MSDVSHVQLYGPLTEKGLHVCAQMCSTCIFRPGNLMRLDSGRVRAMTDEAIANDAFIVCHKTLDVQRSVCRGFYERHADKTIGCRMGHLVGIVEIDPDKAEA